MFLNKGFLFKSADYFENKTLAFEEIIAILNKGFCLQVFFFLLGKEVVHKTEVKLLQSTGSCFLVDTAFVFVHHRVSNWLCKVFFEDITKYCCYLDRLLQLK